MIIVIFVSVVGNNMAVTRNQVAITAAAFVGFTGFTLVMPFLALYMQQLGVSDRADVAIWTGVTLGVTPAISALCAPLWGRVGDRFGNKLLVLRSLVSGVVVLALMAFATRPWHVFALRVLQGFVAGYGPLTIAMAAASAPREQMARAVATVQTAQRVGPAIAPVIGGLLASAIGLRRVFFVAAAAYALAAVIMGVFYDETRQRTTTADARTSAPFRDILALENFLLLMGVIFGLQLVDKCFGPVLVLFLTQLGYRPDVAAVLAGILFSVLAVSGACGNQLAAALLKRLTPRAVIDASVAAAAAALAVFAAGGSLVVLIPAMAVFGAGVGTATTTAFTAAGSVVPREVHGVSFGFLGSASLIGFAVSPVLSGLIAARSIRAVFIGGVTVLAVLALVVRRVMVERSQPIEPPPSVEEV